MEHIDTGKALQHCVAAPLAGPVGWRRSLVLVLAPPLRGAGSAPRRWAADRLATVLPG